MDSIEDTLDVIGDLDVDDLVLLFGVLFLEGADDLVLVLLLLLQVVGLVVVRHSLGEDLEGAGLFIVVLQDDYPVHLDAQVLEL